VSTRTARLRQEAAQRYRPDRVDTLLVAEAPPSAPDRDFYFEHVPTQDSLFRHVVEGVLGEKPTRDKVPWLDDLCERGWFLIHVSDEPFRDRTVLPPLLPDLLARIDELAPRRVLLIGATLYDLAYRALRDAGVPVLDVRLPFPGSGQQRRFLDAFREVVDG
jgi:hypothetical protein